MRHLRTLGHLRPRVGRVSTAERFLQDALSGPMIEIGWRPRASGWFTLDLGEGFLGVTALGVASRRSPAGNGAATLYVGLRVERIEHTVEEIRGQRGNYRDRTAGTSIGYLSAEQTWLEWQVDESNAQAVARELARRVSTYAMPYLTELANDPGKLIQAARSSASFVQDVGKCRVAVLLAEHAGPSEADRFLDQAEADLGDRQDPAAEMVREMARRTRGWLRRSA